MKKLVTLLTLAIFVARPLPSFGQANIESDPAYLPIDKLIDLKAIPPQVNVNLPRFLLKDAISGLSNAPGEALANGGIDIPDLVKDVKLIRVVVIEAKTNRAALDKGVKALRAQLEAKWTAVASVSDGGVGIYVMGDPSGESMAGVAVLIADGGEVVIVNIVGQVSIGKLIKIAAQSNKLPKDLLKKLQGANSESIREPVAKTNDTAKTNKLEATETKPKDSAAK
jgi:hypothetical protein